MKANFVITNPVHFLALGFGSGLTKPAPGTWGTIAAVPLILLTSYFVAFDSYLFVFICVLSFILGIYLCGKAARDVGVHDHSAIVWDEFVGLFVSMMWLPMNWKTLLLAFLLFRLFDILKPWPISWLDKHVHGGFGIMVDDVLAGMMACGVIHILLALGL